MRKGFTMIELMIVMSIVSILTAAAIFSSRTIMPSWRTHQAAKNFAAHVEEARALAIMHDREAMVEIIDSDSDPTDEGFGAGHYQVSVGNKNMDADFWDVLPFEDSDGTDNGQGEGDFDFGKDGRHELGGVTLVEPDTDQLVFDPRGFVANDASDFTHSESGAIEYVFMNKRDTADAWSVLIFRGGMVRLENAKGRQFESNGAGTGTQSTQ